MNSTQTSDVPLITLFFTVNLYMSHRGIVSAQSWVLTGSGASLVAGGDFFGEKRLLQFIFLTMGSPDEAQAGLWLLACRMDVARVARCLLPGEGRKGNGPIKVSPCPWPFSGDRKAPFPRPRFGQHRDLLALVTSLWL